MKTVLLYGESTRMGSVFAHASENDTYTVKIASTLRQAQDYTQATKIDVIVIDFEFSQDDGVAFLKHYRTLPKKWQTAKIIAMSRKDPDDQIQKVFEFGIYKYLLKGVASPKQLNQAIRHVIERASTSENA